jgi:hypothetical protein
MRPAKLIGLAVLIAYDAAAATMPSTERLERRVEARLEQRLQVPARPAPAGDAHAPPPHVAPPEIDRRIIPTAPLDVQVPVAKDRRPALVVVWLGDEEEVPPRDTLTPSPPITLYVEEVGALYRRIRDRFFD